MKNTLCHFPAINPYSSQCNASTSQRHSHTPCAHVEPFLAAQLALHWVRHLNAIPALNVGRICADAVSVLRAPTLQPDGVTLLAYVDAVTKIDAVARVRGYVDAVVLDGHLRHVHRARAAAHTEQDGHHYADDYNEAHPRQILDYPVLIHSAKFLPFVCGYSTTSTYCPTK